MAANPSFPESRIFSVKALSATLSPPQAVLIVRWNNKKIKGLAFPTTTINVAYKYVHGMICLSNPQFVEGENVEMNNDELAQILANTKSVHFAVKEKQLAHNEQRKQSQNPVSSPSEAGRPATDESEKEPPQAPEPSPSAPAADTPSPCEQSTPVACSQSAFAAGTPETPSVSNPAPSPCEQSTPVACSQSAFAADAPLSDLASSVDSQESVSRPAGSPPLSSSSVKVPEKAPKKAFRKNFHKEKKAKQSPSCWAYEYGENLNLLSMTVGSLFVTKAMTMVTYFGWPNKIRNVQPIACVLRALHLKGRDMMNPANYDLAVDICRRINIEAYNTKLQSNPSASPFITPEGSDISIHSDFLRPLPSKEQKQKKDE
jgi:hypothetical protein